MSIWRGVTKLGAFQYNFVTKFYPLKLSACFWKVKIMMIRSEEDWPNYRPSTGGVASPGGSSIPRREQQAQGEQLAQGAAAFPEGNSKPREQLAQGAAAFPKGNSMPRESSLPRGRMILRGKHHAQGEQQHRTNHNSTCM